VFFNCHLYVEFVDGLVWFCTIELDRQFAIEAHQFKSQHPMYHQLQHNVLHTMHHQKNISWPFHEINGA
jgi:hypothetical protein